MKKLENDKGWEVSYQDLITYKKNIEEDLLQSIKDKLHKEIYEGSECPCCATFIKADKVMLSDSMIKSLQSLRMITGNDTDKLVHKDRIYFHWKRKSNVIGKLKHWNFVNQYKNGEYSITEKGLRFLNNALFANEYEYIFNDRKIKPKEIIPKKLLFKY